MALTTAQKFKCYNSCKIAVPDLSMAEYLLATQANSVAYAAATDPAGTILATLIAAINTYRAANGSPTVYITPGFGYLDTTGSKNAAVST